MKIAVVSSLLDRFLCGRQVEKNALTVDYISRGVNLKANSFFMSLGGEINLCWRKNTTFCRDLFKTHLWGNFCGVQSLTFDLGNDLSSCSQDVRWVEGLVFANDDLQYADQVRQTLLRHLLKMLQVLCKGRGGHTQAESWTLGVETVTTPTKKNNFILKVAIANSDLLESQQIAAVCTLISLWHELLEFTCPWRAPYMDTHKSLWHTFCFVCRRCLQMKR